MRISLKLIAFLWIGLLLVISGLLYNAYSKFKPEAFVALLTEQVQNNYPGAKLNVGNISYRFSLDFNLKLQDVHLRRSGKVLGSINEIELKVPWWLLLVNRGNAQINLSGLDIYVDHEVAETSKEKLENPITNSIKVSVPSYLSEAKFTLRAKDVSVRNIHNERRYFVVSKLLVREFQYGKNSAFEINIPIEISHNKIKYFSNLWLFGDVTPEPAAWKLNYRGEFRTRESSDKFQFEDLVINGTSTFAPKSWAINSEINLLNEKDPIGKGLFNANQDALSINLNFSKMPLSYFEFFYETIRNPYLNEFGGNAAGEIKFQKDFNSPLGKLEGKLAFDGNIFLNEENTVPGKWNMSFDDNLWELAFLSSKEEIRFLRRTFLDMKSTQVGQFTEELGFSGIDINSAISVVKPLSAFMTEVSPIYATTISYKNCFIGDEILNGNFHYGYSADQKFYQGELTGKKSSMKLNFINKNAQNSLDLKFLEFSWLPTYTFLQPYYSAPSGQTNGKAEGRWTTHWESGQWLVQMNASELNVAQGIIPGLLTKTAAVFEIQDSNFIKGAINVSVRNNLMKLNSLMLQNTESTKIAGTLSSKEKSILTLSYPHNKKLKPLKREVIEPYWIQKEEI